MKKKILVLGMVLALVAVLVVPTAVMAVDDTTDVSGTIGAELTITSPSAITLPPLTVGTHTGDSTGSVYSTATGWTITVAQTGFSTSTGGHLTLGGSGLLADQLDNIMLFASASPADTTIALYEAELQTLDGAVGSTSIPLFVSQERVVGDDVGGAYSLTLTYTATP